MKTINLGRGEGEVVIRPTLHPRTFSHVCQVSKGAKIRNRYNLNTCLVWSP